MKFVNFTKLLNSFRAALHGLTLSVKEQTIRIMIFITLLTVLLSIYLKINRIEQLIITFTIAIVLSLELLNTQIEKVLDVLKPTYDPKIKTIKDISAGAVLMSCLGAILIGILIFLPYIRELL